MKQFRHHLLKMQIFQFKNRCLLTMNDKQCLLRMFLQNNNIVIIIYFAMEFLTSQKKQIKNGCYMNVV